MEANIKIGAGSLVAVDTELQGDITIGSKTLVHPKARILALSGPIIIGDNNIIEEQVTIINQTEAKDVTPVMIIGNNNVFEVDCEVRCVKIGDHNVIESKAFVGREVQLTNGCVITAMTNVSSGEILPEGMLVTPTLRRMQAELPPVQTAQIEFLSKVLMNYHRMRKSNA
uniref:Dynactin subunit 6 n=1 Tax=Lynceus sp. MCZ IZ 141354 TaxID=1930659 RepID=A0A9N6WZ30_9CRUS|nr:EOG090X0I48 [Lynceus sp. MCZ IZ 141354]